MYYTKYISTIPHHFELDFGANLQVRSQTLQEIDSNCKCANCQPKILKIRQFYLNAMLRL